MSDYNTNYEIAQQISERIGTSPIPFNSVYSLCFKIYQELGGTKETFDDIYDILLDILPLTNFIDDSTTSTNKTWSSDKINTELSGKQDTLTAGQNIIITNNTISAVIDAGFNVEVVQTLPETGEANTIYFVPKEGGANPDVYDEYMYINGAWEKIGSTEVDLSNYYNKTEVDGLLAGKQDKLTAGNNITINGTTISAKDTTYSAGANIDITDNTIKAVGYRYNKTNGAFSEGNTTSARGESAHSEGLRTISAGRFSHSEGNTTKATGNQSHSEGLYSESIGFSSHTEGRYTKSLNNGEHAQGSYNVSHHVTDSFDSNAGNTLHSIGIGTAEDARKNAVEVMQNGDAYLLGVGNYDGVHIKGETNAPSGLKTLQETVNGKQDTLTAGQNVTIHNNTISVDGYEYNSGNNSIITNGVSCITEGENSHAEGYQCVTESTAIASHAEGWETVVRNQNEHAQGRYNVSHLADATVTNHEGNTIVSVGIGEDDGNRKNAFEIMQNGDIYVYGVGNYDGTMTKYENTSVMTLQDILKTIAENTGIDIGVLF